METRLTSKRREIEENSDLLTPEKGSKAFHDLEADDPTLVLQPITERSTQDNISNVQSTLSNLELTGTDDVMSDLMTSVVNAVLDEEANAPLVQEQGAMGGSEQQYQEDNTTNADTQLSVTRDAYKSVPDISDIALEPGKHNQGAPVVHDEAAARGATAPKLYDMRDPSVQTNTLQVTRVQHETFDVQMQSIMDWIEHQELHIDFKKKVVDQLHKCLGLKSSINDTQNGDANQPPPNVSRGQFSATGNASAPISGCDTDCLTPIGMSSARNACSYPEISNSRTYISGLNEGYSAASRSQGESERRQNSASFSRPTGTRAKVTNKPITSSQQVGKSVVAGSDITITDPGPPPTPTIIVQNQSCTSGLPTTMETGATNARIKDLRNARLPEIGNAFKASRQVQDLDSHPVRGAQPSQTEQPLAGSGNSPQNNGLKGTVGDFNHSAMLHEIQNTSFPQGDISIKGAKSPNHGFDSYKLPRIALPEYKGHQDKKTPQQFIQALMHYKNAYKLTDDYVLNTIIPLALKDDALRWLNFSGPHSSLEKFKEAYSLEYEGPAYLEILEDELRQRFQHASEPFSHFLQCIVAFYERLSPNCKEDIIIRRILSQCHPDFKAQLWNKKYETLKDLAAAGSEATAFLLKQRMYQPPPSPSASIEPSLAWQPPHKNDDTHSATHSSHGLRTVGRGTRTARLNNVASQCNVEALDPRGLLRHKLNKTISPPNPKTTGESKVDKVRTETHKGQEIKGEGKPLNPNDRKESEIANGNKPKYRFTGTCHNCGKKGHKWAHCRLLNPKNV